MTRCRSCGQDITWCLTREHRWMPVDAQPSEDGNVELHDGDPKLAVVLSSVDLAGARMRGVPLYRSHMSSCPQRLEHKRKAGA